VLRLAVNHDHARKLKDAQPIFLKVAGADLERGMLAARIFRYIIIVNLGILAAITFLVAGTLVGLTWFDSWRCGSCLTVPAGIYILAIFGLLLLGKMAFEAGEAAVIWRTYLLAWGRWARANWPIPLVLALSVVTFFLVTNWWWFSNWWSNWWSQLWWW
jgi:hypothetical protein